MLYMLCTYILLSSIIVVCTYLMLCHSTVLKSVSSVVMASRPTVCMCMLSSLERVLFSLAVVPQFATHVMSFYST